MFFAVAETLFVTQISALAQCFTMPERSLVASRLIIAGLSRNAVKSGHNAVIFQGFLVSVESIEVRFKV